MGSYTHTHTHTPDTTPPSIIALADTFISFIAGFSVFMILGNFAYKQGVKFEDLRAISGLSLAFETYPVALSK